MDWHTKLKKLVKERGYSQKQFADRCGISETSVSKYLNGTRMPSLEVAHIMTHELGVSLDWLVGDDAEPVRYGRWIPCSERLPKEDGYYVTSTLYREVYCDYWNGEAFERTEMVLAWMSLPEPYKGKDGGGA